MIRNVMKEEITTQQNKVPTRETITIVTYWFSHFISSYPKSSIIETYIIAYKNKRNLSQWEKIIAYKNKRDLSKLEKIRKYIPAHYNAESDHFPSIMEKGMRWIFSKGKKASTQVSISKTHEVDFYKKKKKT